MSEEEKPKRGRPAKEQETKPEVNVPDETPIADLLVEVEKPRNLTREMLAVEVGEKRALEMIPE